MRPLCVFALICVAMLFALFGWVSRFLGEHFGVLQQIALRTLLAALMLGVLFCPRILRYSMSPKEHLFSALRAFFLGPISTGLFIAALNRTSVANVYFLTALPISVVAGPLLFREDWTFRHGLTALSAVAGALLLAMPDLGHIGVGEAMAIGSAVTGGVAIAARKWHDSNIPDSVLAFYQVLYGGLQCLALSLLIDAWPGSWNFASTAVVVISAFMVAACSILISFGYASLSVTAAGQIMLLESVFGCILGAYVFGETLTREAMAGGLLIVFSAAAGARVGSQACHTAEGIPHFERPRPGG